MERIFEIAASVSTPLGLGGLLAAVLFFVVREILGRNLIPQLARSQAASTIKLIVNRLFILALVATVLGGAAFIVKEIRPEQIQEETGIRLSGTVVSSENSLVVGATVVILGSNVEDDTNARGYFDILLPAFPEVPDSVNVQVIWNGVSYSARVPLREGIQITIEARPNDQADEVVVPLASGLSGHLWDYPAGGAQFQDPNLVPYRCGVTHVEDMPPAGESSLFFSFNIAQFRSDRIVSASIDFRPTNTVGDPFSSIGSLLVEEVSFGDRSQILSVTEIQTLARFSAIPSNVLEVTDAVREASRRGASSFQIRLRFTRIFLTSVDSALEAQDTYLEWETGLRLAVITEPRE